MDPAEPDSCRIPREVALNYPGTTEVAEFAPLEDEEIWFNNKGIANVLSMAKIVDRRNEINRRMCSNLHPKSWMPHKTNRILAGELHDNKWNYYACYRSVRLKKEEHKRWDFKTLELNSLVGTCTRCHETGFVGIQPMWLQDGQRCQAHQAHLDDNKDWRLRSMVWSTVTNSLSNSQSADLMSPGNCGILAM